MIASKSTAGKPTRVLHVLGDIRPSGMERMLLSAHPHWRDTHNIETVVLSLGRRTGFSDVLEEAGIPVLLAPPLKNATAFQQSVRLIREVQPHIAHIHTESAFALAVIAARSAQRGIPLIRTVHNIFPARGRRAIARRIQSKVADRSVKFFVAPSEDVAQSELGIGRQCHLVPNWVDSRYSSLVEPRQSETFSVDRYAMVVGNASHIKNQHVALEAAIASRMKVSYHGDESAAPDATLRALNELSRLDLLIYRGTDEPLHNLSNAAVFLLPSHREGMSVALLEALAQGVPCVVSDVPGQQWARAFPRVEHLPPDDQLQWNLAVKNHREGRYEVNEPITRPFSLDPARGAKDYARLYSSCAPGVLRGIMPEQTDPRRVLDGG